MISCLVNKISPENQSSALAAAGSTTFHSQARKWAKIDPEENGSGKTL
jgi:hypothetical protein